MDDWSEGYMSEVSYTFGYYRELNPLLMQLALLYSGHVPPKLETACELGFGQGVTINLHSAASDIRWYGTDFNPSHVAFARNLSSGQSRFGHTAPVTSSLQHASGSTGASARPGSNEGSGISQASDALKPPEHSEQPQLRLYEDSFAEFAERNDLPEFDFIALHGIWSWISEENQATLTEFIRKRLRAGGVVFLSFNALPGWSGFSPVRHLISRHVSDLSPEGGALSTRLNDAMRFVEQLLDTKPRFASDGVKDRLKSLDKHDRHYLAHEYLNKDWNPQYFASVAETLKAAKLQWACSAQLTDSMDLLNLTTEQADFLRTIPGASFRESVRDFMVGRQFRRDYFVKGARRLSMLERDTLLRQQYLVMVTESSSFSHQIRLERGSARLTPEIYDPIVALLGDHLPRTVAEIEALVSPKIKNFGQLSEALMVLVSMGHLSPCHSPLLRARLKARCIALNRHIVERAQFSDEIRYLTSPVTGGALSVSHVDLLFLAARENGANRSDVYAAWAQQTLTAQGKRLLKDAEVIKSTEAMLEELGKLADTFVAKRLPRLKALGIVS